MPGRIYLALATTMIDSSRPNVRIFASASFNSIHFQKFGYISPHDLVAAPVPLAFNPELVASSEIDVANNRPF
jgi:hypothetical protein